MNLAARHKISAIYPGRGFAVAEGLMSYTADGISTIRQIASLYTAQILPRTPPTCLPASPLLALSIAENW
jgi:hypothetical protein